MEGGSLARRGTGRIGVESGSRTLKMAAEDGRCSPRRRTWKVSEVVFGTWSSTKVDAV